MEENTNFSNELTLFDLFRILFKRWLVLLISLIVGAGAGVLAAFIKNATPDYYGTTVMFYVNPVKEDIKSKLPVYGSYGNNITETMVVLLESEYFAEKIISGVSGVPEKEIEGKINPAYVELLREVQAYTSFSNKDESLSAETNQPNNIFYATIKVKTDADFAKVLLMRLQDEAVDFIEENMPVPSGYESTKCIPISVINDIEKIVENNTSNDLLKFSVLGGGCAFVVACIVVVVIDRYKNRSSN